MIKPCKDSLLDGIRVIFKKNLRKEALEFCGELKKLGYKFFAQLVSVTSYTDKEMKELIELANDVKPYVVSMVDTYGLMHAHNNLQMGYANCIAMMSNKIKRTMVVDGSLYGMGKNSGNAPIELIAMYMNENMEKSYDINQILEAIDANILRFYTTTLWGYNIFHYLAASNDCHPNYVTYLMNKQTLSLRSINEILGGLKGEKKLLYDKNCIEDLYIRYQSCGADGSTVVTED